MSASAQNNLLAPFSTLEDAILKGWPKRFTRLLGQCVALSDGLAQQQVVWPEHALHMIIHSHLGGIDPKLPHQMLQQLLACPCPPTKDSQPNAIMSAARLQSPLLAELLAAGFAWDPVHGEDRDYLVEQLAKTDGHRVRSIAPDLLTNPAAADRLFSYLFDVNQRTTRTPLGMGGQAMEDLLAMPVCPDIQIAAARRALPMKLGDSALGHWWPITDRLADRLPQAMGSIEAMVRAGWIGEQALRERSEQVQGDFDLTDFEDFIRRVGQMELEHRTGAALSSAARGLRL